MTRRLLVAWAIAVHAASAAGAQEVRQPYGDREIAAIDGELFQLRDGRRFTVFLVTPEGVAIGDPLSIDTMRWLKDELAARSPGRAVRYVLHTTHRFDRAEGASIFNDTADVVGHHLFRSALSAARSSLEPALARFDHDEDGALDADEWAMAPDPEIVARKDFDGNGRVTADELYRRVRDVKTIFADRHRVALGEDRVDLVHPASWGEPDNAVLHFPRHRIVFAAAVPAIASTPFHFAAEKAGAVRQWVKAIAEIDFDLLYAGDGRTMRRAEVLALRDYLEALFDIVEGAHELGLPIEAVQATRALDRFSRLPYHSERRTHLEVAYRQMHVVKLLLSGATQMNYGVRETTYCTSSSVCSGGGAIAAGTGALTLSIGRFGVSGEATFGAQTWSTRARPSREEEFAFRESRVSVLVAYTRRPRTGFAYTLLAGPSGALGDTRGTYRVPSAQAPLGGHHPIQAREYRLGLAFGVDLTHALGSRFAVVAPVRVIRNLGEPRDSWPTGMNVYVGGGLAMRVLRRVN